MKVQRKHEDYLEPYRRHADGCKESRTEMGKCTCPIWCYGRIKGRMIRLSTGTRSQSAAGRVMDRLLHPVREPESGEIADRANESDEISMERARSAFLASRRVKECSESTIGLYDKTLKPFSHFLETNGVTSLRVVTPDHVIAFVESRKWGTRTRVQRLTNLRVFFGFAMVRKWLDENPADKEKVPSPRRTKQYARSPFTPEQISRILAALDTVPEIRRKQIRAFILLLLYTGMRISDATMLSRGAVDFKSRVLAFEVIKTHRDNTPIELHASAVEALKALPVVDGPYFFVNQKEAARGLISAIRKTKRWVAQALTLAGVKGSPHCFRDTFAVSLLTAGVDIFTVSKLLGHSDVRTTQDHYLNFIPGYFERMAQSTRKLNFGRVA